MSKPLDGIKVLEIGQEIQGPFAALFLADLGASVTKIEKRRTGDPSRWMFPKMIGGAEAKNPKVSHYFIAMNRGKRSVTLNLRKPEAVEIIQRMLGSYDVLVTNYRPGVLDRRGLGFEAVQQINPKLIYGQASSWGPKGPWVGRPSRDILAQAAGGLMSKTGMPDDPPIPAGAFIADHSGGLSLAAGVLAALFARERTGHGQRVDASIYGTLIAMQSLEVNYTSVSGLESSRAGRGHQFMRGGMYSAFRTKDGFICIAGVHDKRWHAFCKITGIEHLENDAEIGANVVRNFKGYRIQAIMDEIFPRRTTAEWLEDFVKADILATEVSDYRQLLQSEQAHVNGYLRRMDHPEAGSITVVGCPISTGGEPDLQAAPPPPELGQHTEEVLLEAGYGWEDIDRLREAEVI
ncbi:MAG TPA: CoA transferase [Candidatus Binataceae bacterium]|jgi:crotonobetainyl-CoA:carnitine CoA-transferase CaiB-like acyl-CoA transferase|nr:CoA transferase [Candidatus Binataceae bacterium]